MTRLATPGEALRAHREMMHKLIDWVPLGGTRETDSARQSPQRRRWQLRLGTAFLLMAAIAVWMAYFVNRRSNQALEARINVLVPLAHELVIDDPKKIAVVSMEEYWLGDNRWEIYLPEGKYRLRLATRGIDATGFPGIASTAPIQAGRHVVALEERKRGKDWRVTVLCDGKECLYVDEPADWDMGSGSESTGQDYPSEQLPPDKPVVLMRLRFRRPGTASQATPPQLAPEGILLWIERGGLKVD